MNHHMADHHDPVGGCYCGAADPDPVHGDPPCDWCIDAGELGAPAPWWHRAWCRFVVWLLLGNPK